MVRRVALAVDTAVVLATPVRTGRARANWQVGLGSAPVGTLAAPSSPGAGASEALGRGQATIGEYQGQGGTIHISNNLPYIGALNDGSSKQAPAGFVESAIMAGVAAIDQARGQILNGE